MRDTQLPGEAGADRRDVDVIETCLQEQKQLLLGVASLAQKNYTRYKNYSDTKLHGIKFDTGGLTNFRHKHFPRVITDIQVSGLVYCYSTWLKLITMSCGAKLSKKVSIGS